MWNFTTWRTASSIVVAVLGTYIIQTSIVGGKPAVGGAWVDVAGCPCKSTGNVGTCAAISGNLCRTAFGEPNAVMDCHSGPASPPPTLNCSVLGGVPQHCLEVNPAAPAGCNIIVDETCP